MLTVDWTTVCLQTRSANRNHQKLQDWTPNVDVFLDSAARLFPFAPI